MTTVKVPITKAGNRMIEVDTSESGMPQEMYLLALEEGLKVLLNRGMSKVPAAKGLEGKDLEDARESAFVIAGKNLAKLYSGELRKGRAAAKDGSKVPGVVMTEARRLAKEVIKNEIRAAGKKVSHVEASEITRAANELLAVDPSFIEMATANIAARQAKVPSGESEEATKAAALAYLSKVGGIAESPKLIKAAAERKTKESLSKTQAGKVAPRKKSSEVRAN